MNESRVEITTRNTMEMRRSETALRSLLLKDVPLIEMQFANIFESTKHDLICKKGKICAHL